MSLLVMLRPNSNIDLRTLSIDQWHASLSTRAFIVRTR